MKFTLAANLWTPTVEELNDAIFAVIQEEFNKAIKKFFEALLSKIPIRTGFLSGSFIPTANLFGANVSSTVGGAGNGPRKIINHNRLPIVGIINHKKFTKKVIKGVPEISGAIGKNEYYYPNKGPLGKILKTPFSGIPFVTTNIYISKTVLTFEIKNLIRYWEINDFNSRGRGTPWGSLSAARMALIQELQKIKIPDLTKIGTRTKIVLNDESLFQTRVNS